MLAAGRAPRAIVCGNDEMAIGALIALRARRLRVPADVAVTGFDDIAAAHHVRPGLTTVRQPMRELGEESVRMLLGRITDQAAPRQSVILPTRTVIRRSCGCRPRPPARASLGRHNGNDRQGQTMKRTRFWWIVAVAVIVAMLAPFQQARGGATGQGGQRCRRL